MITNRQLIFERRTDREQIFVAINAEGTEFTANHGELQGEVRDLAADTRFTMNGQLTMKPYSVQILVFDPDSHPEYDTLTQKEAEQNGKKETSNVKQLNLMLLPIAQRKTQRCPLPTLPSSSDPHPQDAPSF